MQVLIKKYGSDSPDFVDFKIACENGTYDAEISDDQSLAKLFSAFLKKTDIDVEESDKSEDEMKESEDEMKESEDFERDKKEKKKKEIDAEQRAVKQLSRIRKEDQPASGILDPIMKFPSLIISQIPPKLQKSHLTHLFFFHWYGGEWEKPVLPDGSVGVVITTEMIFPQIDGFGFRATTSTISSDRITPIYFHIFHANDIETTSLFSIFTRLTSSRISSSLGSLERLR